jgi:CheY-like chemotaxis protein
MKVGKLIDILLVEDNPGDVRLAQETLRDYRVQNKFHVVQDGEQALRYLRREPPFSHATRPDLVLLDINLPKIDGIEVLEEMRASDDLAAIPVVILTTSAVQDSVLTRFQLPRQCFITKPLTVERYLDAIRCFSHMGLSIVAVATA